MSNEIQFYLHVSNTMREGRKEDEKGFLGFLKNVFSLQERDSDSIGSDPESSEQLLPTVQVQRKDRKDEVSDLVEHIIKLKAFSNTNYLAVDYQESLAALKENEDCFKVLRYKDPFRKALAISRYTELKLSYNKQYKKEYLEIKEV